MPRFQFSLRTLLIVVTLLAIPCGWLGWQAKIVRDRQRFLEQHQSVAPGDLQGWRHDCEVPWIRKMLGDEPKDVLIVWKDANDEEMERIRSLFPEADLYRFESDTVAGIWHSPPSF